MAKARIVRSELRTSETVAGWSIPARYFWILLWGYVDDYGRGKDNTRLIKSDCFPLDDDVTFDMVEGWLSVFVEAGVIVRYSVDGNDFLAITNWEEHQKVPHPGKDAYPDYREEKVLIRSKNATSMNVSGNLHESSTLKLKEVNLNEVKLNPADAPIKEPQNLDVVRLCELLGELIKANGNKVGEIGKTWHSAADRLMRLDGYTPEQVEQVLRWSQQSEFWQGNILSMPKLREKFDTLKGQMFAEQRRVNKPRQSAPQRNLDTVAYFAELERNSQNLELEGAEPWEQ